MPSDRRFVLALMGLFVMTQSACATETVGRDPSSDAQDIDDSDEESAADSRDGTTGKPRTGAGASDDAVADRGDWQPPPPPGECDEGPYSYESESYRRVDPDWAEGARIPATGRPNLYGYAGKEFVERVRKGKEYTVMYPVDVTSSWMPRRLLDFVFTAEERKNDPVAQLLSLVNPLTAYKDIDHYESWLGLHSYPDCDGQGARGVPFPGGERPDYAMGSTRRDLPDGPAVTYSCAGCHAGRLFGRSILGLQNRMSRANVAITDAKFAISLLPPEWIALTFGATPGETKMIARLQEGLRHVGTREPVLRGLDTSLAQVALSLARRTKDEYATRDPAAARAPRPERLQNTPADSKPGNWWVLKYKTRWLLDGSVVSGNPVYTNLLWNEIGRGTDLHELESWLDNNQQVVDDITAAVFAVEAPRFTEFFPAESIDLEAAKRGKVLFDKQCASCHGSYEKGWEQRNAASLSLTDRLATVEVRYHEETPVIDVGTSELRNRGMDSLVQLNDLAISKKKGIIIKPQKGYVPPPLVGIWARFPYFHNNSAPSLCAVLTRAEERPAKYYSGEVNDPKTDFDEACNGYPTGSAVPQAWLNDREALYDTSRPGLSNRGHDEGVFLQDGKEIFTPDQKRDIIEFLQTL